MDTKIAIVTGANRGLGLAATKQLAELGYLTIMGVRDVEAGEIEASKLRSERLAVHAAELDIANSKSVDVFFNRIIGNFGRVDVLLNGAGIYLEGNAGFTEIDEATLLNSINVNAVGAWRTSKAVAAQMMQQAYGRIVNVSSGWGSLADMDANAAAYRISKAALNAVTRIIAADLAKYGDIKVNAVCPGWVRTRMGGPDAELTAEEAATDVVWAARFGENAPTGGFFKSRAPIAW
ncbi:hypothetical protein BZM26_27110 [Paraburkholderia strydomiana]|nr:hypothetical protein BZM26_27110 [Paraburkholderia strydomiana]